MDDLRGRRTKSGIIEPLASIELLAGKLNGDMTCVPGFLPFLPLPLSRYLVFCSLVSYRPKQSTAFE